MESSIKLDVFLKGQDLFIDDWNHILNETRAERATLNEENIYYSDSFEVDGSEVKFTVSQLE